LRSRPDVLGRATRQSGRNQKADANANRAEGKDHRSNRDQLDQWRISSALRSWRTTEETGGDEEWCCKKPKAKGPVQFLAKTRLIQDELSDDGENHQDTGMGMSSPEVIALF
jgi:hypothetical protein